MSEECPVCGPVEGRAPHVEVEVGNLAGCRLERAKEYLAEHSEHDDPVMIPWETTSEAITHIQQLRNREIGIGYLAQLSSDFAGNPE